MVAATCFPTTSTTPTTRRRASTMLPLTTAFASMIWSHTTTSTTSPTAKITRWYRQQLELELWMGGRSGRASASYATAKTADQKLLHDPDGLERDSYVLCRQRVHEHPAR